MTTPDRHDAARYHCSVEGLFARFEAARDEARRRTQLRVNYTAVGLCRPEPPTFGGTALA